MGLSIAKNTVNKMVNDSINITKSYVSQCSAGYTDTIANITLNGCTVENSNLNAGAQQVVNQACITNATNKNNITTNIQSSIQQQATAVVQQFAFGTAADAEEFMDLSTKLATAISTSFTSTCTVNNSSSKANITCTNSTISGSILTADAYQNISQNCILNDNDVNNISNQMIDKLSQTALAKQQDSFSGIIIGFFVVVGLVAIASVYTLNGPIGFLVVGFVVVSVIISLVYSLTAKSRGNYPYNKS